MTDPELPDPRLRHAKNGDVYLLGRYPGHALRRFGEAFLAVDCYETGCSNNINTTTHDANGPDDDSVRGRGHALCTCGVLSPHLDSGRQRTRWHRRHKARVMLGQPEPAGQPAPIDPEQVA